MYIFIAEITETNTESNIIKIDEDSICTDLFPGFLPISSYKKPSLETFYCDIFKPKFPAILEGNSR